MVLAEPAARKEKNALGFFAGSLIAFVGMDMDSVCRYDKVLVVDVWRNV